MPEAIEVDVGALKVGDSIMLSHLTLPAAMEVIHPEKIDVIVSLSAPKVAAGDTGQAGGLSPSTSDDKQPASEA